MSLTIKFKGSPNPRAVPWCDLAIGELYDSQSADGLCIKTTHCDYYSFAKQLDAFAGSDSTWACRRVNATLEWEHAT